MRHRGYERPPQNQSVVWIGVLGLAALGGAAIYFVSRKAPEPPPPPVRVGGVPTTTTPARAGSTPAAATREEPTAAELAVPRGPVGVNDPLPLGVDQWFDEEIERLRVRVKGIDLEEGVSDSWRMELSWIQPGRVRQRPTEIHWNVIHKLPSGRALKKEDFVDLRFDDVRVDLRAPGPHFSWTVGTETCRWTTSVEDFLSVAGTKKVTVQVAAKEWTLTPEALALLRTFAAVVPP
jgi:hypothetical protein